ncbi:hypothetical protein K438DRAFT_834513 [Mycena galopus ATCC 62051]|nr:hypothetical protein K438DRAFT_834513 [Mycena galopus ATCC 62051]
MSQARLSGPVGLGVLHCLLFLILSLPSPFPFSSILIFPRGRRQCFHCCRQRRALPVLTPPKDSRCFSLPPPTLDLFLPISTGSANRSGETMGRAKRTRTRTVQCGSGWTTLNIVFIPTSAFSLPYCPFFLACEVICHKEISKKQIAHH